MSVEPLNPYAGTDLWRMARGLSLLRDVEMHINPRRDQLVWFLPFDVLPGVTAAYGMPVCRVDGLERPCLGLQFSIDEEGR